MPSDNLSLNPPIQYAWIWLIIGLSLLLAIILWFGFIYWHTRNKKIRSLENLPILTNPNTLDALKQKYLILIDECYVEYQQKKISLRGMHKKVSMLCRYFVYEATYFPAPRLTLSDFKRAQFPALTNLINDYYGKEFAAIEHGDAAGSIAAAKDMVQRWA